MSSPAKSALLKNNVPMQPEDRKKLSLVELMMFNMSSVLASVGAGCDVRLSQLSSSQQLLNDSNTKFSRSKNEKKRIINTYHGSTPHVR